MSNDQQCVHNVHVRRHLRAARPRVFQRPAHRMFLISVNINVSTKEGGEERGKNLKGIWKSFLKGPFHQNRYFFCCTQKAHNQLSMKRDMPQWGLI